jgi:hypothetical protein
LEQPRSLFPRGVVSAACVLGGSRSRAIDHEFAVGGAGGGQFLVSFVETAAQLDVLLDELVVAACSPAVRIAHGVLLGLGAVRQAAILWRRPAR